MKLTKILLWASLFFILSSCTKKYTDPEDYVGSWTNNLSEITLNSDSTYILKNLGISETSGTFHTGTNSLIFSDQSGACSDSAIGSYDWRYSVESITGTFYPTLSLTLLEDTCGSRAALVPGKYRKQ